MIHGWRRVFALRSRLVDFEERGFRCTPEATRRWLEGAAGAFLHGFNTELATPPGVAPGFDEVSADRRGLAAEGAAMAAVLLDRLNPAGGRRFAALYARHQAQYVYLLYVGAGWAMATLRIATQRHSDSRPW